MQVEGKLRAVLGKILNAFEVFEAPRFLVVEGVGEDEVYVPEGLVYEVVGGLDSGQLPRPDDPDPVADPLDLAQGVGGEEDGSSFFLDLADDLQELFLHQRVEAAGRLVEDEERRLVEHGPARGLSSACCPG